MIMRRNDRFREYGRYVDRCLPTYVIANVFRMLFYCVLVITLPMLVLAVLHHFFVDDVDVAAEIDEVLLFMLPF